MNRAASRNIISRMISASLASAKFAGHGDDTHELLGRPERRPAGDTELRHARRRALVDPCHRGAIDRGRAPWERDRVQLAQGKPRRGGEQRCGGRERRQAQRNSPTAPWPIRRPNVVLCGDTAARSRTASVALSPGQVALATVSSRHTARIERVAYGAEQARATKGGAGCGGDLREPSGAMVLCHAPA